MQSHSSIELSFELFPTKTPEGLQHLNQVCQELNEFNPSYFSVTFGAVGSDQLKTQQLVQQLVSNNISTTPHISCVHMTQQRVAEMLENYSRLGVNSLVVIQGDLPVMPENTQHDFKYANELVAHIRKITGDHFHISVAAYPEYHPRAHNALTDLQNFKRKVDTGANKAITQLFYNSDAYFRFLECCKNIDVNIPIIPGIMPIHNYSKLLQFSANCGAEIPLWLRKHLEAYADDPLSIKAAGIEIVTRLCERLLHGGAGGLHFYTLNQSEITSTILKNLGLCK
jgi:methylenetetrahydrofolate reductase (NADPH)